MVLEAGAYHPLSLGPTPDVRIDLYPAEQHGRGSAVYQWLPVCLVSVTRWTSTKGFSIVDA